MAYILADENDERLIAGRYLIDLDQKVQDLGGCPAYGAQDLGSGGAPCVALAPFAPSPRLSEYRAVRHENLVPLLALEQDQGALWGFCSFVAQNSLAENLPKWSKTQLIDGVIRPVAEILERLGSHGLTCRNIRPENLFISQGSHSIVLGPLGLSMPGERQPTLFEPLSMAVCAPCARGEGTIACDVFSLGVLVLALALGKLPLDGLSDAEILQKRFEIGSPAAYLAGHDVPDGLLSALNAMLSDDPNSRPSPRDLISIAPRKLFIVRTPGSARIPLMIGGVPVRTPQALAWFGTKFPLEFSSLLQRGVVNSWLQNELDLPAMAAQLVYSGTRASPSDKVQIVDLAATGLTHVLSVLDPLAPMFRAGKWFWPDALPYMLAQTTINPADSEGERSLRSTVGLLTSNPETFEGGRLPLGLVSQISALSALARKSGLKALEMQRRLPYDSNVFLPCLSKPCRPERLSLPTGLLRWLCEHVGIEDISDSVLERSGFLDEQMRAFLQSHCARKGVSPLRQNGSSTWLMDLSLLAIVQRQFDTRSLTPIAERAVPLLEGELRYWRSRSTRAKRRLQLARAAEEGDLTLLLAVVTDPAAREMDEQSGLEAEAEISNLKRILNESPARKAVTDNDARKTGELFSLLMGIAAAMASVWLEFCQ